MSLATKWRSWIVLGALGAVLVPAGGLAAQGKIETKMEVRITADDGVSLRSFLVRPATKGPSTGLLPAIILANPWAVSTELYLPKARHLAAAGYVVLGYSSRGFGGSGGLLDMGGAKDVRDMSLWIDWLIANAGVDPERIGIGGISFGGALAVLAAAHDERIKAAVSLSGWVDIGRALLFEDGTSPGAWGDFLLLLAKNLGKLDEPTQSLITRMKAYQVSQEEVSAFSTPRSPVTYLDHLNERSVPIMFQHCLDDNLFWTSRTIAFYNRFTGPKRLIINLGEHSTSDFMGAFGVDNGVWDRLEDWFDFYLKGKTSTFMADEKPIIVPVKRTKKQLSFTSWPDESVIQSTPYGFYPDGVKRHGILQESAIAEEPKLSRSIINGRRFGVSTGSAMLGPGFETHFRVPNIKLPMTMDSRKVVTFVSSPLTEEKTIFGTPDLTMTIVPSTEKIQLVAYLYSYDRGGILRPISHGPITLRNAVKDVPQRISLKMLFSSYAVPKGSSLMLAIGTYDPYYLSPNDNDYQVQFIFGEGEAARLNIPFMAAEAP